MALRSAFGAAAADIASGGPDGSGVPRSRVVEIQRSRLLAAAIRAVDELGYAETTVAQITGRARISRRTFYELFENREDCLAAILEDVAALLTRELATMELAQLPWRERVRAGLWTILCFFDREPMLARVCVVHALGGGPGILARREAVLRQLVSAVDEGRSQGACATDCTALTAEGVVGAAVAVVHGRLARGAGEPLAGLLGELTSLIVLPYQGAAAARREQRRPVPAASTHAVRESSTAVGHATGDPLAGLPMRWTYRTVRVLEGVGRYAGASNRQIADYAGITDQGQISKLLGRLERLGLLANHGQGHLQKGEPNAWRLTARGQLIAQNIRIYTPQGQRAV